MKKPNFAFFLLVYRGISITQCDHNAVLTLSVLFVESRGEFSVMQVKEILKAVTEHIWTDSLPCLFHVCSPAEDGWSIFRKPGESPAGFFVLLQEVSVRIQTTCNQSLISLLSQLLTSDWYGVPGVSPLRLLLRTQEFNILYLSHVWLCVYNY